MVERERVWYWHVLESNLGIPVSSSVPLLLLPSPSSVRNVKDREGEPSTFPDCWCNSRGHRSVCFEVSNHFGRNDIRYSQLVSTNYSLVTYPAEFAKTRSQFGGKVCYVIITKSIYDLLQKLERTSD